MLAAQRVGNDGGALAEIAGVDRLLGAAHQRVVAAVPGQEKRRPGARRMSGADAVAILKALLAGEDYPPAGVADTPASRKLWADIAQSVDDLPAGVIPDIHTDWPSGPTAA
jgi:hypothetical protein